MPTNQIPLEDRQDSGTGEGSTRSIKKEDTVLGTISQDTVCRRLAGAVPAGSRIALAWHRPVGLADAPALSPETAL